MMAFPPLLLVIPGVIIFLYRFQGPSGITEYPKKMISTIHIWREREKKPTCFSTGKQNSLKSDKSLTFLIPDFIEPD